MHDVEGERGEERLDPRRDRDGDGGARAIGRKRGRREGEKNRDGEKAELERGWRECQTRERGKET